MFTPKHTPAFDLAWHFVTETNENIFLTGKAGTGKTTFLKFLREHQPKNMAVAAPTGVAAINAGGVTLHSMFHIPPGPFIPAKSPHPNILDKQQLLSRLRYNTEKIRFFHTLELLVIDEVSMVSCYLLDAIDTILRHVRHRHDLLFGGVQVLFIGDLYQLQPVIKPEEWQFLKQFYSSIFFFDSQALRGNLPVIIELKEIFRQHDNSFIEILNGIRDNNISQENLKRLNGRLNRNFRSEEGDGYITLTTHNNQADSINQARLKKLSSASEKFIAEITGDFPEQMFPGEKELVLKKNAQVMFICNDTEEKKYFNGKIGIVTDFSDEKIIVRCDDENLMVNPHTWENIRYTTNPGTKELREETVGTFKQYPLRLAWAITIHKSQGLTFNKLVVDAENAFVKGQVYVALSRATNMEGLVLSSPVNDRFLGAHENLATLHDNQKDDDSLRQQFEISRQKNMELQLSGVFSFNTIHHSLLNLKKQADELELSKENNVREWIHSLLKKEGNLIDISKKFELQIRQHLTENARIEENEKLQKRIAEASGYFSKQLHDFNSFFLDHPFKIKNHVESKRFDKQFKHVAENIKESIVKMDCCKKGFMMIDFLKWKKVFSENEIAIKKSFVQPVKENNMVVNEKLSEMLADLRNKLAVDEGVLQYMIYSNAAITNCCDMLPGDKKSLLEVSGFGKKKVAKYGDDVIDLILSYCDQNNIEPNIIQEEEKKDKNKLNKRNALSPTVIETIDLFRSGKSITDIMMIRKLAESTIEGHLSIAIRNKTLDIYSVMKTEEIEEIKKLFDPSKEESALSEAWKKSNSKFSYGKLKMVQAWMVGEIKID
jgi:hypothetical protein